MPSPVCQVLTQSSKSTLWMNSTRALSIMCLVAGLVLASCGGDATTHDTPDGGIGQSCHTNGTCDGNARCVGNVCEACTDLAEGCSCLANRCTSPLECRNGLCQRAPVPEGIGCYTPCREGLELLDGTYVECGADGLMPGCITGFVCNRGACEPVPTVDSPVLATQACREASECAEHQECVGTRCQSTCENSGHCPPGLSCFRHTCRAVCNTSDAPCPAGQYCSVQDGETGYCEAASTSESAEPENAVGQLAGTFSITPSTLRFGTIGTQGSFTIVNNAATRLTFTIKKVSHTEYANGGAVIITTNPLNWLLLGQPSDLSRVESYELEIAGRGGSATIKLAEATNPVLRRWRGEITVEAPELGRQKVDLNYVGDPDGQWSGQLHFYANFPRENLDGWILQKTGGASRETLAASATTVRNALFQKWAMFSSGDTGLDGLSEWNAVLTATEEGTWDVARFPEMKRLCQALGSSAQTSVCYPYENAFGVSVYTSDSTTNPVPSGVSSMSFTMNVRPNAQNRALLEGRVESSSTLQYPGNPSVRLELGADPADCSRGGATCLVDVKSFRMEVVTGGRYLPEPTENNCSRGLMADGSRPFTPATVPSLLPGFMRGTSEQNGDLYLSECRDTARPYDKANALFPLNPVFSAANPIPDGRVRVRVLEGIDGALIDQDTLFILFRETFANFLGEEQTGKSIESYGYMILKRSQLDDNDDLYKGTPPATVTQPTVELSGVGCSDAIVRKVFPSLSSFEDITDMPDSQAASRGQLLSSLARTVVTGMHPSIDPNATAIAKYGNASGTSVHYICQDTGLIDQGPLPATDPVACPPGSRVDYFTLEGVTGSTVANLPCNRSVLENGKIKRVTVTLTDPNADDAETELVRTKLAAPGTCGQDFDDWKAASETGSGEDYGIALNPVRLCLDANEVRCDTNRTDLLAEAKFITRPESVEVYGHLTPLVDDAFRYKTRFRSRSGSTVGFTPEICAGGFTGRPYCYDPSTIEDVEDRTDCAVSLLVNYGAQLEPATRTTVDAYLRTSFAYDEIKDPVTREVLYTYFGFEHMNAELLIMLGDDAYTQAFASRFDLAEATQRTFEGDLFEPGGARLTGVAGFEMFSLYQAAQYYQRALDRFYRLSPLIWKNLKDATYPLATAETAMSYFGRLIRASTQKAETWNAISERYQALGRPDLARLVIERGYASTYLESVVFSQILVAVLKADTGAARAQIVKQIERAQLSYSRVLRRMSETYHDIRDVQGFMGFGPDYLPFPALDPGEVNAFESVLASAWRKVNTAAAKEDLAISRSRDFDVDGAAFESELVSIKNNHENELATLCGTFEGDGAGGGSVGRVYPAIPKYAMMSEDTRTLGDPCGLVGNGLLSDSMLDLEGLTLKVKSAINAGDDILSRIAIEQGYVTQYCMLNQEVADYEYAERGKVITLQQKMEKYSLKKERVLRRSSEAAGVIGTLGQVSWGSAAAAAAQAGIYALAELSVNGYDDEIKDAREGIAANEQELGQWRTEKQCDFTTIESNKRVMDMVLDLDNAELAVLEADYALAKGLGQIRQYRNEAKRLMSSQEEAEQLAINVQAAKNDPNVRIYKNDAVLTAQRTFEAAMREAYRATKIYEYYTSQSYAATGDLYLVRMVSSGEPSLESYLTELESAYDSFEETFGKPDRRVAIVSLRDDIFEIPRLAPTGAALTVAERTREFREMILDPSRVDASGHVVLPFSLRLAKLSPFTRNHKIDYVEAELVGTELGDTLGRVYFRQSGTGVVRTLDDARKYYLMPERMAVLNPFFSGFKALDPAVYRNEHLRDRPLVNTRWELILNMRDEDVNRDVDLGSLSDVRLYIYYSDFTEL